jgi:hypothetical protein
MIEGGEVTLHHVAGDNSAAVDVVFFHGLGGHYEKTWTNTDTKLFWPKALHKVMPNLRVWALQYPSVIACWTKSGVDAIGDTVSIAREVRARICDLGLMNAGGKPCVWVCHSLGGLVAKHVLLQNQNVNDAEGKLQDTLLKGIMFLGTPHRGSGAADLGQGFVLTAKAVLGVGERAIKGYLSALSGLPISALPNMSGKLGHLTKLIEDLENRNDQLWSLDSHFSTYFTERWSKGNELFASVVCEGIPMELPPMTIVDKRSADPELRVTSSGEAVTPRVLSLDHAQLAKPRSEDSALFLALKGLLARLPELNDPSRQLMHGLTGGQQTWDLAVRLQRCFGRPSRKEVLAALRSNRHSNVDHTLSDDQFVLEVIKQLMGDGSAESCLKGISFISAFLKAGPNQVSDVLPFCDEVVGWLALVCGAPSPFDAARKQDADELAYPGFVSDESRINDVFLATAHAHHKQWPMRSITPHDTIDSITMQDIAALDPDADVRISLERCALGVGGDGAQSLSEYAQASSASLAGELSERESNWLMQHVSDIRYEQKGIILDARKSAVDSDQTNALKQSVLLPVLTLVRGASEPEGPEQQRLDQAIMRYRSNRADYLAAKAASKT